MVDLKIRTEIKERIEAIDWFSHCGQPLELALSMKVVPVSSWKRASVCYHDHNWEDTTLEARNAFVGQLCGVCKSEFEQWNILTKEAKGFLTSNINPKLEIIRDKRNLDKDFIALVRWDLLAAIMEDIYQDCLPPSSRFFSELLSIYEAGHFPCGWAGGE